MNPDKTKWPLGLAMCVFSLGSLHAGETDPLRIHLISGAKEYQSEPSLKGFIKELEKDYHISGSASWGTDNAESLDGLEALAEAHLLVVFARRLDLPDEQMGMIRAHWEAGKPVIGIRTASHAFQGEDNRLFDREVLGNHYDGHYGNEKFEVMMEQPGHPVLEGVVPFESHRLYKTGPLPEGAVVVQTGDIGKGRHALTIINRYRGGRMFYTSLGVVEDFKNASFRRLLRNAVFWTTQRDETALRKGDR